MQPSHQVFPAALSELLNMWLLNLVLPQALFLLNRQAATQLMQAVLSGGFGAVVALL